MEMLKEQELTTHQIFKKVLSNIADRRPGENKRYFTKKKREILLSFLKVDAQTVNPIDFTNQKYNKNLHEKNLFMFVDDNFKIIGFLLGNVWNKEWENEYERYTSMKMYSGYKEQTVKNRKHMTEKATYILMFTPKMRTWGKHIYHGRFTKRHIHAKDELNARLIEYKRKKAEGLPYEQTLERVQETLKYLVFIMFDQNAKEDLRQKVKHISNYNDRVEYIIRELSDAGINYQKEYLEYKAMVDKYGKDSDYTKFTSDQSIQHKVTILAYYNAIFRREQ